MLWNAARKIYDECKRLGLCRSQRDFSRRLLDRGPHYLRLVINRQGFLSDRTVRTLKRRLHEAQVGAGQAAADIDLVLEGITLAEEMARWLRRRR